MDNLVKNSIFGPEEFTPFEPAKRQTFQTDEDS